MRTVKIHKSHPASLLETLFILSLTEDTALLSEVKLERKLSHRRFMASPDRKTSRIPNIRYPLLTFRFFQAGTGNAGRVVVDTAHISSSLIELL